MTDRPQHIFITGGSSGIGFATAQLYASRGADVSIVGRNEAKLAAAADELARISARERIHTLSCDVTDAENLKASFAQHVEAYGLPDVLINAAGIVGVGEFVDLEPALYRATIETDLMATVESCRFFAPRFSERGFGHIANVASVAAYMGIYGYSAYSAAKFGVLGFSEALRFEMKPQGVGVSVLCPPDTKTPGFAEEVKQRPHETSVVAGNLKVVEPEVIARALVRGIDHNKYLIIPGFISKFYFRLKGVWPEIYFLIVDGDVRKARREKKH